MANAVAKKKDETTALAAAPAHLDALLAAAGEGQENIGREDRALPFLKVLQGLSPELEPGNPKYLEAAKLGDFVNSITNEVFSGSKGVRVVRVSQDKKWIEWRPRKAGGGLVRISDSPETAEALRIPPTGNPDTDTEIIETAQIYCLLDTVNGWVPVVLSLTKTKLKFWRKWNTLFPQQTFKKYKLADSDKALPVHGVFYRLSTALEKNAKGTYAVPVAEPWSSEADAIVDGRTFAVAEELRKALAAGQVKVKFEDAQDDAAQSTAADDVPGADDVV